MTETPTTAQVAQRFLAARRSKGLRAATLQWYSMRLRMLPLPLPFADISPVFARARLDRLTGATSPENRRNVARAWIALWTWARRAGIAAQDVAPALHCEIGLRDRSGAAILTVPDASAIMTNLAPALRPAAAVLLFAGLRPQEIRGRGKDALTFGSLNFQDRILRVPASIAKTRKWRVMEGLPDALWRWIPTGKSAAEPLSPVSSEWLIASMQRAGGFVDSDGRRIRPWPHDGTRHSFATYALALTSDAARVGLWLGHEGNSSMLHRHYRGLTTKADAERYFAISP